MKPINPPLLKRYLKLYKKHPHSRIFAPLVHIYRALGEREKALQICRKGVEEHPSFASGYIALALLFLDMNKPEKAVELLEKAVELSPENLLAHKVLAQTWLQLKDPEKTLQAYKKLLFLDPENKKAKQIVQKMEPMTAKDYPDSGFAFKNLQDTAQYVTASNVEAESTPVIHPIPKGSKPIFIKEFEAHSAIAEALIYRGEFDRAGSFLTEMRNVYSHQEELYHQIQFMEKKLSQMKQSVNEEVVKAPKEDEESIVNSQPGSTAMRGPVPQNQKKIQRLRQLMRHLEKIPIGADNKL